MQLYSPLEQLGREPEMQATPVHHTGRGSMQKPEGGSPRANWLELKARAERLLQEHPRGDPWHDEVQSSYFKILDHLGVQDLQHQILEEGNEPLDLETAYESLKSSPSSRRAEKGLLPYRR